MLEALLATSDNLPARLDAIRLAAKRGDAAAVNKGVDVLARLAPSWPAPAQAQLDALRQAAATNPRAAATRVLFLKNVLVREPAYRRALAQISTPLDAVGEPIEQFIVLPNPKPGAAPADTALQFSGTPKVDSAADTTWAGIIVATAEAAPAVVDAGISGVRLDGRPIAALPAKVAAPLGPDAVLAADLNYDFRTDLVVASAGGVQFLRQGEDGRFTDVTPETTLPASIVAAPARAVWAADADTDGDLDVVLAPAPPMSVPWLLRNNGDGTFAAQQPFAGRAGRDRLRLGRLRRRGRARRCAPRRRRPPARAAEPARRRVPGGCPAQRRPGRGHRRARSQRRHHLRSGHARRRRHDRRADARRSRVDADRRRPGPARRRVHAPRRRRPRQQRRGGSDREPARRVGRPAEQRPGALRAVPVRAAGRGGPCRRRRRRRRPHRADRDRQRSRRHHQDLRQGRLRVAGGAAEGGDRDRGSAHQLVRHRRIDRGAHRPPPAAEPDRRADRPRRPRHGDRRRGHPHRVAERRAAVGVRPAGEDDDRGQPAAQGIVSRGCSPGTAARWRS